MSTQIQLDQAQSTAAQASAEIDRMTALLERYAGVEEGTQADIVLAQRNVDVARARLDRAILDIAGARIVAPQAGTVLAIHIRAGEKVGEAGVVTLGNVDRMMAELEVYQTDIGKRDL
nr:hypothetical protein [Marinicella sp. W31]MDC2875566.1 hypothetical protein [Marinicella sp. W31]